MASGFGGGWSHDSNTGTLINANAPSDSSSCGPTPAMKSKKGSESGNGLSQDRNTGTLMNTNVPSYKKQPKAVGDKKVTLNSFGGGWYQDSNTVTLTRIISMNALEKGQGSPGLSHRLRQPYIYTIKQKPVFSLVNGGNSN